MHPVIPLATKLTRTSVSEDLQDAESCQFAGNYMNKYFKSVNQKLFFDHIWSHEPQAASLLNKSRGSLSLAMPVHFLPAHLVKRVWEGMWINAFN